MNRQAATHIFGWQRASGFLFDLEISLIVHAHALRETDLPVTLYLAQEKSSQRIASEVLAIAWGLPALAWRYRSGYYRPQKPSEGITADDWGLTPGVNQGILELAKMGVVRRVSMMAYSGYIREGLEELQKVPGVRLGLHFDLTYAKSSPGQVLLRWIRPGADRASLSEDARAELRKQLSILEACGVRPQYLDGHHRIHLVPGLLDGMAPILKEAGIREVRLPLDRGLIPSKLSLVALAWLARNSFRRHDFQPLSCIYPQEKHFEDPGKLRARLGADPWPKSSFIQQAMMTS